MAAIDFPDSPTLNQQVTLGGFLWQWNGDVWRKINAGKSAYAIAVDNGFTGTEAQWLVSLVGADGADGAAGADGADGVDGAPGADGADGSPTRTIRSVSSSTTLQSGDLNQMVRFTGTSAQVLTIADVLTPGTSVEIIQDNSGSVEFQSGSGVTLLSSSGLFKAKGQNSVVTVRCVASGQYRITGDVRIEAEPKATGGTITSTPLYFIHTFTSSGTFTPTEDLSNVEYLVIAGGGGGGTNAGAGGGAGGYRSSVVGEMSGGGATAETRLSLTSETNYTVTVGAGGVGGASATQGVASVFGTVTTVGGGKWANGGASSMNGGAGGSGGGASAWVSQGSFRSGGAGTAGQGFAGGDSTSNNTAGFPAAGGGGAGGAGQTVTASSAQNVSGLGGAGVTSSITGTAVTRASGATGQYSTTRTPGGGGAENIAGDANTGGGGGADFAGGSGIVIVRYPI